MVLLYHHFDTKTPPSTSIDPQLFAQHLKYLKDNNFNVLSVKELVNNIHNQHMLPDKCAVLTADDAYISIYKNALPLLKKYNMTMSVFVATQGIDDNYKSLMSYKQMQSTKKYISYYNHSTDHSHFYTLNKQQIKNNITTAQKKLLSKLNTDKKIFAYPYGEYNLLTYNTIKELGFVAFGQHSGTININSDLYALPRFPMTNKYGAMPNFITKINTIAMPLLNSSPISSVVTSNPPTLKLQFTKKIIISCFIPNNNSNIIWQKNTALITATKKLIKGRTKYNCTAKSPQKNRFYWFSKQWLVL